MNAHTPPPSASVLASRAMLAYLTISQWTGRRLDREVTDELNTDKGAKATASRVNKQLLPPDALAPIQKIASAARDEFLRRTLPWVNDGGRILPAVALVDIGTWIRAERKKFHDAVDKLIVDYPGHLQQARNELGAMFKIDDYPDPKDLEKRFAMDMRFMPVPSGTDFRVDLAESQLAEMREEVERSIEQATNDAMKNVYSRIGDVAGKMVERLSAYKGKAKAGGDRSGYFRDSLVTNISDLVAILPSLNITNDPKLMQLTDRLEALAQTTPKELRESDKARSAAQQEAKRILDLVAGWAP